MQKLTILIVTILFVSSSIVLAVPAKKTLEFSNSPYGCCNLRWHSTQGRRCQVQGMP